MISVPDAVAAKLPHLPESPGVYLWKDAEGTVLYVGKARRLRSRVRSYFASDHRESPKTRALVGRVVDLDTLVVPTDAHALVLEANLIKEYRPKFNIALRDDKSYPYIKVTVQERFPRVWVTRRVEDDGARYFGPYTDVGAMRRALNVVRRVFTVRSCNYDLPRERPERACLDHDIGRCKAPCVGLQSEEDYQLMIRELVAFLDGRTSEVVRRVRERMQDAAEKLDFERAAELRDALRHLQQMEEPAVVVQVEGGDRDVVGYARDGDDACVALLRVRDGRLLSREHRFLENIDGRGDAEVLSAYLTQTYLSMDERAAELLVPHDFEDRALFEESLGRTHVVVPQRGIKRELIELAEQNARHLLEELKLSSEETDERAIDPVYELARVLELQRLPRSFVCFDISTAQGTDTVGSCVWFENGRPRRAEYRKFRVKTVEGTDDFASMNEVVTRYFTRRLEDGKPLPDLVVVDGGKGQLGAAREALHALALDTLPLVSLAKREEEVFIPGRSESVRMPRRSAALRMLQRARDEAHRFAITYNRKRRTMRTVTSELLKVPGVGPSRRRALLTRFGSVQGVREAGLDEIAALPGFSHASAARLLEALARSAPDAPPAPDADVLPAANLANDRVDGDRDDVAVSRAVSPTAPLDGAASAHQPDDASFPASRPNQE